MNISAQKAILAIFKKSEVKAGESLRRDQLVQQFISYCRDPDALDEGIEGLMEAMSLEADDVKRGPSILTEDGHRDLANFD
jgi:hypothetical protein